jgi:hypothetical protein
MREEHFQVTVVVAAVQQYAGALLRHVREFATKKKAPEGAFQVTSDVKAARRRDEIS